MATPTVSPPDAPAGTQAVRPSYSARLRARFIPAARSAPRPTVARILLMVAGVTAAGGLLAGAENVAGAPLLIAPLGAAAILVFGSPDSPLAQPRNILGGFLLASLVGFGVLAALGDGALASVVALALTMTLMQLTGTLHPPAGAIPLLILVLKPGPTFVLVPTLLGAALLVLAALVFNNLGTDRSYPRHWW